ncbi:hypothetical protein KM043_010767 [Ampulex compressa]|nr:hypothetical protein KM043_010767 [Ampulex compressa]
MIETFVFFDLETTGLAVGGIQPKITECAFVAVSRNSISDTKNILPRVLHKLVLPVCPNKKISSKVQSLTGLCNDDLDAVGSFDTGTYDLILNFISRLKPPICFVAHNGNGFDYPVFLSEVANINKDLSETILCVDTYVMFKQFFVKRMISSQQEALSNTMKVMNCLKEEDVSILFDDGYDDVLSFALDSVMEGDLHQQKSKMSQTNGNGDSDCTRDIISNANSPRSHGDKQKTDSKTPQTKFLNKMQEINEKTPEAQIFKLEDIKTNCQDKHDVHARRKLDFTRTAPSSFKLTHIYTYFFCKLPQHAHAAEADCLMMIQCVCKIAQFFLEWADHNAVPLIVHKK